MISPVSFSSAASSASGTSFQDLVKKPQTYIRQDVAASSPINEKSKKESSTGKTILKVIAGAAAAAGLIALGSRYGVFTQKEGGNKIINTGKSYLDKAGKTILEKGGQAVNFVKNKAAGISEKVSKNTQQPKKWKTAQKLPQEQLQRLKEKYKKNTAETIENVVENAAEAAENIAENAGTIVANA